MKATATTIAALLFLSGATFAQVFKAEGATANVFIVTIDPLTNGFLRVFRGGPLGKPQTMLMYDVFIDIGNGEQNELIGTGTIANNALQGNGITSPPVLVVDTSPATSPGFSNQVCASGQIPPCPQGPGGVIALQWQVNQQFPSTFEQDGRTTESSPGFSFTMIGHQKSVVALVHGTFFGNALLDDFSVGAFGTTRGMQVSIQGP